MPEQKDLKRLVRARMQKTGESYAAARLQVVEQSLPSDDRLAEMAGMSNEALRAKPGATGGDGRARWLPGVELRVRTSIRDKSMRVTWPDDTSVHLHFTAKGSEKSQVAVQHVGLSDREDATRRKEYWTERLASLQSLF